MWIVSQRTANWSQCYFEPWFASRHLCEVTVNVLNVYCQCCSYLSVLYVLNVYCQCCSYLSVLYKQLHKCIQEFTDLDDKYQQLRRSSFDADARTLTNIELYPCSDDSVEALVAVNNRDQVFYWLASRRWKNNQMFTASAGKISASVDSVVGEGRRCAAACRLFLRTGLCSCLFLATSGLFYQCVISVLCNVSWLA